MLHAPITAPLSKTADQRWEDLVDRYRDAKSLAICGESAAARELMRDALPPLMREWSRASELPRNLQLLRLRELFHGKAQHLVSPKTTPTSRPTPQPTTAQPSGQRVPLNDIARMIDAVTLDEIHQRKPPMNGFSHRAPTPASVAR